MSCNRKSEIFLAGVDPQDSTRTTNHQRVTYPHPPPSPRCVDRSLRMSAATKKKALDKREAVQKRKLKLTHLQRQERYQQLKSERLQREREEYESLTPDQKRRRDLKEEKKARKRGKQKVRWMLGGPNGRASPSVFFRGVALPL